MVFGADVIVAEPNWPIMLPFGILVLAIALGPLIAQYHWERHYHKLCVASPAEFAAITLSSFISLRESFTRESII